MASDCVMIEVDKSMPAAMMETSLSGLNLMNRGKVRDVYDLGDRLLIVTTDRISAFDSVLGTPIPDKGRVLTQLSLFWMNMFSDIMKNHFITESTSELGLSAETTKNLEGRSMIVRKARALPVECVVRGYIIGSGWKEYQAGGSVCGIPLKAGLRMADKLDEAIFTPSTKAETGHDENISFERAREVVGAETADGIRKHSLALYRRAADYAAERGIIIADTKFEFGLTDDGLILIDEALTPDSSRFWPEAGYKPGISPPSFDKQFVRDWLEKESGWDKEPPAPALPLHIVGKTREKYMEALERLTGAK